MPEKQAHAATAATEFDAFMKAAVDAIVVIEPSGEIIGFSLSAEEMFGYEASEVLGRQVSILMPEPYRSAHSQYVERYEQTGEAYIIGVGREVRAVRKDGTVFPVWLSVGEAMSESGHRFVGIVRDLTEQRAAEAERHSLETRLAHVARLSLLGEMAAGIAHEINQPLSAISNYSQAAKNMFAHGAADTDTLRSACDGIAEQAQRAAAVISNLRNFVRKREVEKEPLSLKRLIDDVMILINADAAHKGVMVEVKTEESLPEIAGNAVQLQQVLLNLTRNAVDAMSANVRRPKEITIKTLRVADDRVEIRVSDRGPGISSSLEEAIFHPFFTTKEDGLGVGLAISRTIVDAHGGELSYERRREGGSTFVVSLPILER